MAPGRQRSESTTLDELRGLKHSHNIMRLLREHVADWPEDEANIIMGTIPFHLYEAATKDPQSEQSKAAMQFMRIRALNLDFFRKFDRFSSLGTC